MSPAIAAEALAARTADAAAPRIPEVTDEQVRHYVEEGYLVVKGLVSPAELAELKADMAHLARGGYPCASLKPLPADTPDDEVLRQILCIHQPHFVSPVMRRFAEHPGICRVLSRIVAAHLPWWDGAVKCMQTMLFVKPPGWPGQAWHQDEIYIPTRDRSLAGAWIAIDDATVANGCLRVIPRSHRNGYLFPQRKHGDTEEYDFAECSYDFARGGVSEADEVIVEVPAGSVVFFNGYLLHRSTRNRSGIYRRALVSHYMNAWSLLPWYDKKGMPEGARCASADCRRVFMAAGEDPYAWKGYEPAGNDVWLRHCVQTKPDIRA